MVQVLIQGIHQQCNWLQNLEFIHFGHAIIYSEARQDKYRDEAVVEIEAQESGCDGFIGPELVSHRRPHDDFSIGAAPAVETHRQTVRAMEHDTHQAQQQKHQTTSTNHSSSISRHCSESSQSITTSLNMTYIP